MLDEAVNRGNEELCCRENHYYIVELVVPQSNLSIPYYSISDQRRNFVNVFFNFPANAFSLLPFFFSSLICDFVEPLIDPASDGVAGSR